MNQIMNMCPDGALPHRHILYRAIGDSMAPKYEPGALLVIDLEDTIPREGPVLMHDGLGAKLACLQPIPGTTPSKVRVFHYNPTYSGHETTADSLTILGRVKFKCVPQ